MATYTKTGTAANDTFAIGSITNFNAPSSGSIFNIDGGAGSDILQLNNTGSLSYNSRFPSTGFVINPVNALGVIVVSGASSGGKSYTFNLTSVETLVFSDRTVTLTYADTTPPVFASATVNGSSLVMTYTEANTLDAANAPAVTAFTVSGTSSGAHTVSAVAVNAAAKTVTLTLATAVANGETVTVAYTDPTAGNDVKAIQDAAGNDAVTLAATAVTNNTPVPTNHAPTGAVTITGTATQGQTLTESHTTLADADGIVGTVSIQWYAGGTAISGATAANYTLTSNEVNKSIKVVASYTDGHGTPESVSSDTVLFGATLDPVTTVQNVAALHTELDGHVPATGYADVQAGMDDYYKTLTTLHSATTDVAVRTISVTSQGSLDVNPSAHEALVIDTTGLTPGARLDLNNVDFAIIIADETRTTTIRGGEGNNIVYAGAGQQDILLGAGDDILHGGAGNDTIGSLGGTDQLFGDAGNDILSGGDDNDTLWGGAGDDTLWGGNGIDTAAFSGNFANYTIKFNDTDSSYQIKDNVGTDGTDVVHDVEVFQFADFPVGKIDDNLDPSLNSVNLGNPGVTGVAVGTTIVFTFSEDIALKVVEKATDIVVHAGSSTGAPVAASTTVSGNTLTIDPTANLSNSTHYYVTLASGSIHDLFGHSNAITTYDFTTADPYVAPPAESSSAAIAIAGIGGVGLLAWLLL